MSALCRPKKTKQLKAADAVADLLLDSKVDKQGQPLIDHVRRVADRCAHLSHKQQLAAVLHDCLEDADDPDNALAVIVCLFGREVFELVNSLSRGSDETYLEYIDRLALNAEAIPVKLADLADNMDEARGDFPGRDRLVRRYVEARRRLAGALVE